MEKCSMRFAELHPLHMNSWNFSHLKLWAKLRPSSSESNLSYRYFLMTLLHRTMTVESHVSFLHFIVLKCFFRILRIQSNNWHICVVHKFRSSPLCYSFGRLSLTPGMLCKEVLLQTIIIKFCCYFCILWAYHQFVVIFFPWDHTTRLSSFNRNAVSSYLLLRCCLRIAACLYGT